MLYAPRFIPTSVARWVSETKTPRCGVFVSGVAQSASFEARLCLAHKTTHDGDWALFAQTFLTTMRRWRAMKNPTFAREAIIRRSWDWSTTREKTRSIGSAPPRTRPRQLYFQVCLLNLPQSKTLRWHYIACPQGHTSFLTNAQDYDIIDTDKKAQKKT